MTTINDRLERLENAFASQMELNKEIVETLKPISHSLENQSTILNGVVEVLHEVVKVQKDHSAILNGVVTAQQLHSKLLGDTLDKLGEHSADLTIIKEYLG